MSEGDQSPAAAAALQRMDEIFAEWLQKNHNTAGYWAAATGGLMGAFVVAHWTRKSYDRYLAKKPNAPRSISRATVRPILRLNGAFPMGPLTILPGKFALALVYLGINVALTFYDNPEHSSMKTMLSKRFGWMALCNLFLAVFLGLKNTPLSPLAGHSFDSLNMLHRCVGYTTILYTILHGTTYTALLFESGHSDVLNVKEQYFGAVAGSAMLALLSTSIGPVRRRAYELFYNSHLILVTLIIIAMGLHRPEMAWKAIIITILTGAFWFADKSLRLTRWIYHGIGNHATLHPLANNMTRVRMHRSMRVQPGSSAFLWIPSVKLLQRHPFTIVSSHPVEFVIKAHDGFTRSLYDQACKTPGIRVRASLEGPYGHVPNAQEFDKVVLIAGGCGVTFTMALALAWARTRKTPRDKRTLDFVWCVKNLASLEWFDGEIKELGANPRVRLMIRASQETVTPTEGSRDASFEKTDDVEKMISTTAVRSSESNTSTTVQSGRPDVDAVVGQAMRDLTEDDRMLVAACGPAGLLNDIRNAVAARKVARAPSIEMYLEQFSF